MMGTKSMTTPAATPVRYCAAATAWWLKGSKPVTTATRSMKMLAETTATLRVAGMAFNAWMCRWVSQIMKLVTMATI